MSEKAIEEVAKLVAIKNSTITSLEQTIKQQSKLSKEDIIYNLSELLRKIKLVEHPENYSNC